MKFDGLLLSKDTFLQLKHTYDLSNTNFNYLCENSPNFLYHFWNQKSFFTTQLPCIFLAQTLHTFYESSPSKCKFSDFPLLALKLTKLLMSFLKQKVSFSSKFASLFSIMREFFCTFLVETLYVIDKGSTSRCTFSDLPMLALKFAKFLKSFLELRVSFLTFYACSTESLFISYKKFPRKQSS